MRLAWAVVAVVATMAALPAGAQTTLWVEDQNGKLVGQFLGEDGGALHIWAEIGSSNGFIRVNNNSFSPSDIYFDQDGCKGNALVFGYITGGLEGPVLVLDHAGNLYQGSSKRGADVALESMRNSGGLCNDVGFVNNPGAATLVQADFAAQFTPPFRIRAEAQQQSQVAVDAVSPAGLAALGGVIMLLGAGVLVSRRLLG